MIKPCCFRNRNISSCISSVQMHQIVLYHGNPVFIVSIPRVMQIQCFICLTLTFINPQAAVIVWDVGIPSASEYRTKYYLLMRLVCPRASLNPVLNLIFMPNYETLLAGCEDGVFAWTIQDFKRQRGADDRLPTMELKIPTRREPCFDGLARLSENLVVVKCVEEGELYVFDFSQVSVPKSMQLYNTLEFCMVYSFRGKTNIDYGILLEATCKNRFH